MSVREETQLATIVDPRLVFDVAPDAPCYLDSRGPVALCNPPFLRDRTTFAVEYHPASDLLG